MRSGSFAAATAIGLALAMVLPRWSAKADEKCQLIRLMSMDMDIQSFGGVAVPITIDGHSETFLVDTGGLLSMLTATESDALGLVRKGIPYSRVEMYGGKPITSYATAKNVQIGTLKLPSMNFMILPGDELPAELAGTLSPDVLSAFDLDFDFAANKLSFFSQEHCPGRVVYWTHDVHEQVPITVTNDHQIKADVELDGQPLVAAIDTGSSRSEMSLETAERTFGFDEKNADLKPLGDADSKGQSYRYPFKTLSIQGIVVTNPDLILVPDEVSGMGPRMGMNRPAIILGMGVLRQLHLYIAYKEKNLYVSAASAH